MRVSRIVSEIWSPVIQRALRGSEGMGVVSNSWFDRVSLSIIVTRSSPHIDRCSSPLPWDPLSSPQKSNPRNSRSFGLEGLLGIMRSITPRRRGVTALPTHPCWQTLWLDRPRVKKPPNSRSQDGRPSSSRPYGLKSWPDDEGSRIPVGRAG